MLRPTLPLSTATLALLCTLATDTSAATKLIVQNNTTKTLDVSG